MGAQFDAFSDLKTVHHQNTFTEEVLFARCASGISKAGVYDSAGISDLGPSLKTPNRLLLNAEEPPVVGLYCLFRDVSSTSEDEAFEQIASQLR